MKIYQLINAREEGCTAWAKAPSDVAEIVARMGASPVSFSYWIPGSRLPTKIQHLLWYFRALNVFGMKRGSLLLIQNPFREFSNGEFGCCFSRFWFWFSLRLNRIRVVFLIHDMETWRKWKEGIEDRYERDDLRDHARAVIVHNTAMRDRLASEGVPREKMICLEIFDYLVRDFVPHPIVEFRPGVTIAGNLRPDKAQYLSGLPALTDVEWHLYGQRFEENHVEGPNIHYEGCFTADQIPMRLNSGFGLVWDGTSVETCAGDTGQYLRFNNPHKLSLYLTAGLPVIVWKESAEAEFVARNGVGIAVSSLREIGPALKGLSPAAYFEMCAHAREVSEKLRAGHFTRTAMEKVVGMFREDT